MKHTKEVLVRLIAEAQRLGVANVTVERRRKHPCLVGEVGNISIMVVLPGSTIDANVLSISRQYLRRELMRARELIAKQAMFPPCHSTTRSAS